MEGYEAMTTMKEAGVTRKMIVDSIITDIQKRFDLSKAQATEYFDESLAYNVVTEAIGDQIAYMIETGRRLDCSPEE